VNIRFLRLRKHKITKRLNLIFLDIILDSTPPMSIQSRISPWVHIIKRCV